MRVVFLYGPPASGKLTVGRELAERTGFRLFHNHLVVDLLTSVFEFGSEPFIELREEIWIDVMRGAARSCVDGLIFTFAPERTVREGFVARLQEAIESAGGEVTFVELTCPEEEIERRLANDSRHRHGKLTSVEQYRKLKADGAFGSPRMPEAAVSVDTSDLQPADAARIIAAALATA